MLLVHLHQGARTLKKIPDEEKPDNHCHLIADNSLPAPERTEKAQRCQIRVYVDAMMNLNE